MGAPRSAHRHLIDSMEEAGLKPDQKGICNSVYVIVLAFLAMRLQDVIDKIIFIQKTPGLEAKNQKKP